MIVTDPSGRPLDAPLTVDADVAWVGYANAKIRAAIEPLLQRELRARGWLAPEGPGMNVPDDLGQFVEMLRGAPAVRTGRARSQLREHPADST